MSINPRHVPVPDSDAAAPTDRRPFVVVGGGMAGGRAAEFLAVRGKPAGGVVLVGDELDRPYHRPYLSKEFIYDEVDDDRIYFKPQDFYDARRIGMRLGTRATSLDLTSHVLKLEDGDELEYCKLILAPGTFPRRLPVPGAQLAGVHYLRTIADARALRRALAADAQVVVVGGGFIGVEVAAACRMLGLDVTVVEAASVILRVPLGADVGTLLQRAHERRGVRFRTSTSVARFVGTERVEAVELTTGEVLPAAVVAVGIGVEPDVDWLADSGLELDNGIVVDGYCRTSDPDVFAAGDAVRWHHEWYGSLRLEHETNAQNQAMAAARNALGKPHVYRAIPYVWSDQGDLKLRYVGHAPEWDDVLLEHEPGADSMIAAYCRGGLVCGVLTVNQPHATALADKLLHASGPFPIQHWRQARASA